MCYKRIFYFHYFYNDRLKELQGDAIAGTTVALTVIPQGLALAQLAELPPQVSHHSNSTSPTSHISFWSSFLDIVGCLNAIISICIIYCFSTACTLPSWAASSIVSVWPVLCLHGQHHLLFQYGLYSVFMDRTIYCFSMACTLPSWATSTTVSVWPVLCLPGPHHLLFQYGRYSAFMDCIIYCFSTACTLPSWAASSTVSVWPVLCLHGLHHLLCVWHSQGHHPGSNGHHVSHDSRVWCVPQRSSLRRRHIGSHTDALYRNNTIPHGNLICRCVIVSHL